MWISEQEHLRQFLDGADWFVDNQDDNGGWPSQVRSKQTNNQNVINKSKKNRMNRLNKFFFRSRSIEGAKSIQEQARLPLGGTVQCVRCQVCTKTNQHQHKNNLITGSLLIFMNEMPYSMHSNIFPTTGPGNLSFGARPLVHWGQQLLGGSH